MAYISLFDMFRIGIGPSSSHTVGPMVAASRFVEGLRQARMNPTRIRVSLHGSLAFTGRGHATDRAVILGLAGCHPARFDAKRADRIMAKISTRQEICPPDFPCVAFDPATDLIFDRKRRLPGHANGMTLTALTASRETMFSETYYSIGGGTVVTAAQLANQSFREQHDSVPHPFSTADDLVKAASDHHRGIPGIMSENERALRPQSEIETSLARIWAVMKDSIARGLRTEGTLPGGLRVKRRAPEIYRALLAERQANSAPPHVINDWISVYAMAVNEENASAGQIVTAPTNGAAGIVPATIRYYLDHVPVATEEKVDDFLFAAAAIGGIIKTNASISGADCGCQAEVGSAAAMAAAGLCQILNGTPRQVENAAEIALEHHLGMTCDPVGGLVQIPCIERNGLGAIKAVSAASLALRGDGQHVIPLDACIDTMRRTGIDMHEKYKETSRGGLAVSIPEC